MKTIVYSRTLSVQQAKADDKRKRKPLVFSRPSRSAQRQETKFPSSEILTSNGKFIFLSVPSPPIGSVTFERFYLMISNLLKIFSSLSMASSTCSVV